MDKTTKDILKSILDAIEDLSYEIDKYSDVVGATWHIRDKLDSIYKSIDLINEK